MVSGVCTGNKKWLGGRDLVCKDSDMASGDKVSTKGIAGKTAKRVRTKAKSEKFRQGRAGCESLMFLVRGYHPGTQITNESGKRNPQDALRICGSDIHEVTQYLKRWEPHFDVRSIRLIGLAVLLSGSPYQQ